MTPIKRRAYIKILGPGRLHITNSYNNKIFDFEKDKDAFVDLINLKKVKYTSFSDLPPFYANVIYINNQFIVSVTNRQDNGYLGGLDFHNGPREKDFRCVIVEN